MWESPILLRKWIHKFLLTNGFGLNGSIKSKLDMLSIHLLYVSYKKPIPVIFSHFCSHFKPLKTFHCACVQLIRFNGSRYSCRKTLAVAHSRTRWPLSESKMHLLLLSNVHPSASNTFSLEEKCKTIYCPIATRWNRTLDLRFISIFNKKITQHFSTLSSNLFSAQNQMNEPNLPGMLMIFSTPTHHTIQYAFIGTSCAGSTSFSS